jgi:hypothetical protein
MGTEKTVRVLYSEFYAALSSLEDTKERNRIMEWLFRNSAAFKKPGMTETGKGTVNMERDVLEKLGERYPRFYNNLVEAHAGVRPEEVKFGEIKARIKRAELPARIVDELTLPEFVRKRLGAGKKR